MSDIVLEKGWKYNLKLKSMPLILVIRIGFFVDRAGIY
jgi:hypothetical protein